MGENNTTSSATVMRLNVSSNSNTLLSNTAPVKSTWKTVTLPSVNSASNCGSNLVQKVALKLSDILKETNASDVCFKGENLQQLSTNVLPSYVPPSPTNMVHLDASGYEFHCCTDCGDTFALSSSLVFHLERRSVLIKLPCETCKTVQIFYNRCTLLSHIRSHTDKNETSDIGKAVVNPIPRAFMDGLQSELSNSNDEELPTDDRCVQTPTDPSNLMECSLNIIESDMSSPEKEENDEETVKVKCLDCNEEFDSSEKRAQHLTQDDKIPVIVNQCNKCNMVCPSKCFLKAHQRIHFQLSPYVCPECGESPSPLWTNFQYHVKFNCFHNARGIGYKCPVCKRLCSSNDSLLKHMELHTEKYAKCGSCPRAYMNTRSFNAHIKMYHPGASETGVKYNLIYKCSLCDIVFLNQEQMLSHRSSHLKEQICEYVFSCMQCGKPLENKVDLLEHIKGSHPKIYKHIVENTLNKNKTSVEPVQNTYRGTVECLLCSAVFPNYQGYKTHLSKAHFNYNQPCTYCYMVFKNREEMIAHGKKHLNKGSFLCLLCNNKRWTDEKQLENHLKKHAERVEQCTFCPICHEILKTPPQIVKHLFEEHRIYYRTEESSNAKQCIEIITCHFCRVSFASESELQEHLKIKHQVNTMKRHTSAENGVNENKSKKQHLEGNVCAKCDYHSIEREDFKKHILSHKTNKGTSQCQECGLCFVVEPALVKHLKIVHKISDTTKYIEKEGTNYMPDFENHTEVTTCSSLICSVCFTTFPNETSLKTHMRSHGMAFIQAAKSTSNIS